MYQRSKNSRIILFSLLAIMVISFIMIIQYFDSAKKVIYSRYLQKMDNEYNIIIDIHSDMADLVFKDIIDTEPVKELLNQAYSSTTPSEKNLYREELKKLITPVYNDLVTYNIRQLHFHEENNHSFLRMHKPDKYGDDLTGIRYSVEFANREKTMISGFEEGRIFNGYRNVYPLILSSGVSLGSVEISFSMSVLVNQFKDRFEKDAQFILLKSLVDEKVFVSEQDNYSTWTIDDNFVLDNNINGNCILSDDLSEPDKELIRKALSENGRAIEENFNVIIQNESEKAILTFKAVRDFTDKIAGYIFYISDSSEISEQNRSLFIISMTFFLLISILVVFIFYHYKTQKRLQNMISFDLLTKAFSRRCILEKLDEEFERYIRYQNNLSIAMIDIDYFKKVNDVYGHSVGDLVLSELSSLVLKHTRKTDFFGRYGGEEFLLILPETDLNSAVKVVENLRKTISEHPFPKVGQVTVSCGLAISVPDLGSVEEYLEISDKNLYTAKKQGRNRVVFT